MLLYYKGGQVPCCSRDCERTCKEFQIVSIKSKQSLLQLSRIIELIRYLLKQVRNPLKYIIVYAILSMFVLYLREIATFLRPRMSNPQATKASF